MLGCVFVEGETVTSEVARDLRWEAFGYAGRGFARPSRIALTCRMRLYFGKTSPRKVTLDHHGPRVGLLRAFRVVQLHVVCGRGVD